MGASKAHEISQMKHDATFFHDKDPRLVYIARRLRDALDVEELLDRAGLNYGVEPDTYQGGIIFRTERVGAFFYVFADDAEHARTVLAEGGFRPFYDE